MLCLSAGLSLFPKTAAHHSKDDSSTSRLKGSVYIEGLLINDNVFYEECVKTFME